MVRKAIQWKHGLKWEQHHLPWEKGGRWEGGWTLAVMVSGIFPSVVDIIFYQWES